MDYRLVFCPEAVVWCNKMHLWISLLQTCTFSLLKMLIDGLAITCGLLWCFNQLFGLSFWRHPFTAEHLLLSEWCNARFLHTWWRKHSQVIQDVDELESNFSVNNSFRVSINSAQTLPLTLMSLQYSPNMTMSVWRPHLETQVDSKRAVASPLLLSEE